MALPANIAQKVAPCIITLRVLVVDVNFLSMVFDALLYVSLQEPTVSVRLKRSNSLGGVTSLSADTLPTYITDAARKRCMAIR